MMVKIEDTGPCDAHIENSDHKGRQPSRDLVRGLTAVPNNIDRRSVTHLMLSLTHF